MANPENCASLRVSEKKVEVKEIMLFDVLCFSLHSNAHKRGKVPRVLQRSGYQGGDESVSSSLASHVFFLSLMGNFITSTD